jgi:hypothetical protein
MQFPGSYCLPGDLSVCVEIEDQASKKIVLLFFVLC